MGRTPDTETFTKPYGDALPSERYRYSRHLADLFWKLCIKSYPHYLASRKKWKTKERNLEIGDRVLICDPNAPRGQWKMGHVYAVHPGKDGNVRVDDIHTESANYRRPIHRLFLIEENSTPVQFVI